MTPAEAYILDLESPQREIAQYLNDLIQGFPEISGKIRYKIPFYYRKSWICYLNPVKGSGIELAFTRANELSNAQGLLNFKNRKQVAGITIYQLDDIDENVILEVLQEAIILDETIKYASKRSKHL